MRSETVMRVNLQREGFTGIEPLQTRARPTETLTFLPWDFVNDKLFESDELSKGSVVRVLLPANAKTQLIGVLGF
jgi:hypothetical protein